MKHNSRSLIIESIFTEKGITENSSSHRTLWFMLRRFICGFLFVIGFWGITFNELGLSEEGMSMAVLTVVSFAVMAATSAFRRKLPVYIFELVALAGILVIFFIAQKDSMAQSLALWNNKLGSWYYLNTGIIAPEYLDPGYGMMVGFVIAVFLGILTEMMMRFFKGRICAVLAAVYIIFVIIGWADFNIWGFIFVAAAITAMVSGYSNSGKTVLAAFILLAAAGAISYVISSAGSGTLGITENIRKAVHDVLYERGGTSLTEGDLSSLGAWKPEGKKALEISMDNWKAVYIKGFTAGKYTGQSWDVMTPEELQADATLLYSLHNNHVYSSSQPARAAITAGAEPDAVINIKNVGACKYYEYLPYGADTSAVLEPEQIVREGTRKGVTERREFYLYPVDNSYSYMGELGSKDASEMGNIYIAVESAYRNFVYKHYLDIPEETAKILEENGLLGTSNIPSSQARDEINRALAATLEYDETAVSNRSGSDFIEYTLNVSKRGYDVHFATIAVMMLRSFGIPARYVEGYLLTSDEAASLASGQTYSLTDMNNHAWVEFYLDGIGWIPYDPTPGRTDEIVYTLPEGENGAAQDVLEKNKEENEKQNDEPDNKPDEPENKNEPDTPEDPQNNEQKPDGPDNNDKDNTDNNTENKNSSFTFPWFVILIFLLVVAVILITVIRRIRLGKKYLNYERCAGRRALAGNLCYSRMLIASGMGVPEEAVFENIIDTSKYLEVPAAEAVMIKQLMDEVWLSDHEINENMKSKAIKWLTLCEKTWRKKTGLLKQFKEKFITCRIY